MKRRQYLITTGAIATAVIAGCSSPETEGDDDSPIDAEPEELLPSADLFGDGWEQYDSDIGGLHSVELEGNTSKASFTTGDDEEGINLEVTVFDSVDEAMSGYEEMRDYDIDAERYFEDIDVASEGHLMDFEDTYVYFRDANVIGALVHVMGSNAVEYAADWHETWRD
jgi:hypothetical protein